jgi:hypothetical protein
MTAQLNGARPLRLIPGSHREQTAHRSLRLRTAPDGLDRIGTGCRAPQARCGHHGPPTDDELAAALAAAGGPVSTGELVRLLLWHRGCTAVGSHGVRNHLHRAARTRPAGCRDGGWCTELPAPGAARQWWAA